MPPVVVTAPRPDPRTEAMNRPGFVSMVDLSARAHRVEDLPAVLSQLVGVRVTQYGGLGSFATMSIRGSSSSQVRAFLDGMPIDDPYLGITNIADLPLGGVDRVEVYRGFSPPALGGSAIGGAVQLVTRMDGPRDATLSGVEASASAGSFDTRRQAASLWLKPAGVRVFAHGTHEVSSGDFTFDDDNGTPENPGDDEIATRTNNDFEAYNAIVRAGVDVPGIGALSAGYYDASREQGVPGLGSYQSATSRSERRRQMAQARLDGTPVAGSAVRWSASGYYQRSRERFRDPDGDISMVAQDTENVLQSWGGGARARWHVPWAPLAFELDATAGTDRFRPRQYAPSRTDSPDRQRGAMTIALGGDAYLFAQSLVVSGAFRLERHTDEFGGDPAYPWLPPSPSGTATHDAASPSLGARWQARPWLAVKANAGRYYRLPTFLELFGNAGSVTGSADLVPETGVNRDLGVVLHVARAGAARSLRVEVSRFQNDVENLILFFPNSQHTSKPVNIGSARLAGWETSVSASLFSRLDAAVGYTYMDTGDTGDIPYYRGNDLPSRPAHDVNASVACGWRSARATYELHYVSANWLDRANYRRTPARDLHALTVTVYTPVQGVSFSVEGRNLTDERATDVAGFPLPGRSVYSTIRYQH